MTLESAYRSAYTFNQIKKEHARKINSMSVDELIAYVQRDEVY